MAIIVVDDLPESIRSHELIDVMVEGVNAKAGRVAPCLIGTDPEPSEGARAEARLILIGAVRRWVEAGAGAFSQQTAGPFSVATDTRQRTGFNLWPSEIAALQELCSDGPESRSAFAVDTAPPRRRGGHIAWCNLLVGGTYCSCGSDINDYEGPLFEGGILSPGY